jgi:uncharacterized membrane protein
MRIRGHPVHPMLVHFPVAFWTVAVLAYVVAVAGLEEGAIGAAKLANGAGLVMALPAMVAGLLELRTIDERSEALRVATWHLIVMTGVWLCFLIALLLSTASQTVMDPWTAQLVATAAPSADFCSWSWAAGSAAVWSTSSGSASRGRQNPEAAARPAYTHGQFELPPP